MSSIRMPALALALLLGSFLDAGELSWMEIRLSRNPDGRSVDRNEGITLGDVDRDGKMDVIAGGWWYRAPNWDRRRIRDLETDREFARNNGDLALDVNGDGWVDVITGSWFDPKVMWFENPGREGLDRDERWKGHQIGELNACEGKLLADFDGDKVPELVLDSWEDNVPVHIYRLVRGAGGPNWEHHAIGSRSGHGMGIGDVNGDGRPDVVVKDGWYETPETPWASDDWKFHRELDLGHTSLPFAVFDVNGDGMTDLVYGEGHSYGMTWLAQGKGDGGKRTWTRHSIEAGGEGDGNPLPRPGMVISQVHVIVPADLDMDGRPELVTGKRLRGHGDGDGGWKEPIGLYRYTWDAAAKAFTRHTISESPGIAGAFGAKSANDELQLRGAVGAGMQICVHDLNGDGRPDVAVAGKSGTYILMNQPDAR